MRDIKNWLLGILSSLIIGVAAYGVNKVEQIGADVNQIKVWQAEINTAANYDDESYKEFTAKLNEVGSGVNEVRVDVRTIKDTQVKTWDKVLELDERLRDLERQVDALKKVVFRTGIN